jgi:hypothetical protein
MLKGLCCSRCAKDIGFIHLKQLDSVPKLRILPTEDGIWPESIVASEPMSDFPGSL